MNAISVIVSTYNRCEKVHRAVASAMAQRGVRHEIIVVDDGSADGTADALRTEFGDRIRVIEQANAGVSAARNRGVLEARCEWIAFLDSDDLWHHNKLQLQLKAIEAEPECVLACTGWTTRKTDLEGDVGAASFTRIERPLARLTQRPETAPWLSTWLIRKDEVIRAGMFDRRLRVAEDTRLLYRLSEFGPFVEVNAPLAWRSEEIDVSKLTTPAQERFQRDIARATAEVLAETSVRAINADPETRRRLDRMLAYYWRREAEFASIDGQTRLARELARRCLYLRPRGRDALIAVAIALAPQIARRRASR